MAIEYSGAYQERVSPLLNLILSFIKQQASLNPQHIHVPV